VKKEGRRGSGGKRTGSKFASFVSFGTLGSRVRGIESTPEKKKKKKEGGEEGSKKIRGKRMSGSPYVCIPGKYPDISTRREEKELACQGGGGGSKVIGSLIR